MHPLVSTEWLAARLDDPQVAIADARWRPSAPGAAREAFAKAHIPGAIFFDLDEDLSALPADPAEGGRHPLPEPAAFATRLARSGIGAGHTVVCYDDMGGAIAGRLWWMLRWIGHERSAVLDGGLSRWINDGNPTETGGPKAPAATDDPIRPLPRREMLADKQAVLDTMGAGGLVLDARDIARFRGEGETLDPVGGHIPGATSAPFKDNLTSEGVFRDPAELRQRFVRLGGDVPGAICHCGSGVTACHNILAMAAAGLPTPRLYVGSWSEWCRDPSLPKARGE